MDALWHSTITLAVSVHVAVEIALRYLNKETVLILYKQSSSDAFKPEDDVKSEVLKRSKGSTVPVLLFFATSLIALVPWRH